MSSAFVPYPPIEKHGVIGDRRTAALIAADGTLGWLCLPNYSDPPVFGALLDSAKGGCWRLGPEARLFGHQSYISPGPILQTAWEERDFRLELLDFMPWPQDRREASDDPRRAVVRRLRCTRGAAACRIVLDPRLDFGPSAGLLPAASAVPSPGTRRLSWWCSAAIAPRETGEIDASFTLSAGEEMWFALESGPSPARWTAQTAAQLLRDTTDYWERWIGAVDFRGERAAEIRRSAMLVHLLTFAPTGAPIASPTTSLPERIGGARNYDYRYTWIRDASLSLSLLAKLGRTADATRFLDWLVGLVRPEGRPLEVVYAIDGKEAPGVTEHPQLAGYRGSRPVRTGNAAAAMAEIDSYGYLTDCVLAYLRHGGRWQEDYWFLIERAADYTAKYWHQPGSSIWELRPKRHFVASKVMSVVTLDRAATIAEMTGHKDSRVAGWRHERDAALAEVLNRGWSERMGAFRQHYGSDSLDAAALLIPIMNVLSDDDPRVVSTIEQLVKHLDVNGFLHRFTDDAGADGKPAAVGEREGAFFMCSFWLVQTLTQRGEHERADAILRQAETIAGDLRLFSEAVDARDGTFLGNNPLMFSQVEYARAALAFAETTGGRNSEAAPSCKHTGTQQ